MNGAGTQEKTPAAGRGVKGEDGRQRTMRDRTTQELSELREWCAHRREKLKAELQTVNNVLGGLKNLPRVMWKAKILHVCPCCDSLQPWRFFREAVKGKPPVCAGCASAFEAARENAKKGGLGHE